MDRRGFLLAGGAVAAGLGLPGVAASASPGGVVKIKMRSDSTGAKVGFDPVGLLISPGQTVRWIVEAGVHTTTAYHPRNAQHSQRIPGGAQPWDSGYLINPRDHFDIVLAVEGVYDYFCAPHEMAGMVGRIIVGRSGGPGSLPYDYFQGRPAAADWRPVPEAARRALPPIETILARKIVPLTGL